LALSISLENPLKNLGHQDKNRII